jgi:hypothetical protein
MAVLRHSAPAALLALLLLGACDSDAANLAKEITDARGDCTQEKLKAGDEACVEMMEKYAAIGTSAIETYIGAVKSMDQALQRMPPANFDTAGFGHALTPSSASDEGSANSPGSFGGWGEGGAGARDPRGESDYGSDYDPRYSDPGYGDPRYSDPRYPDPRYADPRNSDPRYPASGYADPEYRDPRYPDPRDPDAQYSGRRYPDAGGAGARDPDRGDADPRYADPRADGAERGGYGTGAAPARRRPEAPSGSAAAPPAPGRGLLLPPEQRLDRPWLRAPEEAERRETPDRTSTRPRAERPDGYLPSRPLTADTLGPYDGDRPRTRRPEGY